jgi:hypothetical protein
MLKVVRSSILHLEDLKNYLSIVKEAEKINETVLCERFSYEKLKVRVLSCKVENFSSFLMR